MHKHFKQSELRSDHSVKMKTIRQAHGSLAAHAIQDEPEQALLIWGRNERTQGKEEICVSYVQ